MNPKTLENTATFLLGCTLIIFFFAEIILNLTPPISRDALIHHLAIPKLWLQHGSYYETPWAEYSYYPIYIDLIYFVCLYFKNDIAPKFIHMGFGLATGWLIYCYLKERFDRNWALLGMVIFITTPIVVWLATAVYIDLGMTFFTTGSVLAFIKWRDSEYSLFRWFLISSFCMGIAIGSKYNALIAWFIVNMFLVLSFARDTRKQIKALQYGILFSAITVLVASPWYLKNYLQTGNPSYPLFNGFFKLLHHPPVQEALRGQVIEKTESISFFKMREVMYGESFWETLLIPIRMFFQGQDNSYQYFQGSLNPILIIFLPFSFFNKRNRRDKIFFACFTVIFIFIAFFLTSKQVRYILPVIPFLSIIAIMGIKDVMDWLAGIKLFPPVRFGEKIMSITRIFLFVIVVILLTLNFVYLKNRINLIKPFPYVAGKETREAYLKRHLLHYDAVDYINKNLPIDAKIFTMFLGGRGYYLNRNYKNEASFGMNTIRHMVVSSVDEDTFDNFVQSMNITHILMRSDLFYKFLYDNFSRAQINRLSRLINKRWTRLYDQNRYVLWDIHTRGR